MKHETKVTTRFAPSPTGAPHIGNIRTAIFAWLFARSNGGRFLLRIEDTDKNREVKGSVEDILESLEWLGIDWDQMSNVKCQMPARKASPAKAGGSNQSQISNKYPISNIQYPKLIFQSQRLDIYQKYAEELVKNGYAYVCACSEQRLKELRERQMALKQPPRYDGHCRAQIQNSKFKIQNYVIRLKVPHNGQTEFDDIIRGQVSFKNKMIDDQVLLKSDGYPTYHLANVVDDYLMGITHVLRAEEWLSSTPKHLLLYNFFGWQPPRFAHLPMILGKDRSKLSKRHGAVSLLEYKKQGYLPDAIFNYLILLGWRPQTDQEIFSRQEIIKQFSLDRVQKSPAVFDQEKLDWMNGWYIRQMTASDLLNRLIDYGQTFDENKTGALKTIKLVQNRMRKLSDFGELSKFIVQLPDYPKELLIFRKATLEATRKSLKLSVELMEKMSKDDFSQKDAEQCFKQAITDRQLSIGEVLHPLRVALTGLKDSPGPFETAEVLGKAECLRRLKLALAKVEKV